MYKSALQSSFDHRAWEEAKRQFLLLHGPSSPADPREEETKEDMETTESSVIRTTQVGRLKKGVVCFVNCVYLRLPKYANVSSVVMTAPLLPLCCRLSVR